MDSTHPDDDTAPEDLKGSLELLLDTYRSREIFLSREADGSVNELEWFNSTNVLLHRLVVVTSKLALAELEREMREQ